MLGKSLGYKPNLIPAAIQKTKERLGIEKGAFEPLKSQYQTGITCSLEEASIIWSGWRESNPLHQVGNLR